MMKILDAARLADAEVLNRRIEDYTEYEPVVRGIISRVREEGDAALRDFAEKFDGGAPASLELSADERRAALARVSDEYKAMLERAAANIREFHEKQVRQGFSYTRPDGTVLGQKFTPVQRAGIYVPGGTASYPSTVLMNAIPAKVAGVGEIIMATPPARGGKVRDEIVAAAEIAGVDRIFLIGGAGAIAALAFGTESVPRVDKITGPGNIYVALAKKEVFGTVGIDMVAGPSEILVIADDSADAPTVAADLLSQAEHDRLASAVLVTTDRTLAENVAAETERQLALLPREEIARASVENCGKIIVAGSIDEAVRISNAIAPEHLELCVKDPFALLDKITAAGSIFLGHNTPEAAGDYFAGPNHTLPTGGSARFSSPLSVDDFVKKSSFICYSKDAFENAIDDIVMFAESEGLSAHARSAEARRK